MIALINLDKKTYYVIKPINLATVTHSECASKTKKI